MSNGKMNSRLNIYALFKVIAFGIPAILIVFGAILVFFPHSIESFGIKRLISDGWYLIIIGLALYFIEICYLHFFE
jgi:hypothetical protein